MMNKSARLNAGFMLLVAMCVQVGALSTALAAPTAGDRDIAMHRIGVTDASPAGGWPEALLFYAVAGAAGISAIGVAASKSVVRMAVWLFLALGVL